MMGFIGNKMPLLRGNIRIETRVSGNVLSDVEVLVLVFPQSSSKSVGGFPWFMRWIFSWCNCTRHIETCTNTDRMIIVAVRFLVSFTKYVPIIKVDDLFSSIFCLSYQYLEVCLFIYIPKQTYWYYIKGLGHFPQCWNKRIWSWSIYEYTWFLSWNDKEHGTESMAIILDQLPGYDAQYVPCSHGNTLST